MGQSKTKLDEKALPFATISEISAALRSREISCVELTKFFGRRLESLGRQYNALALSLNTASYHVKHVFTRLRVHSREEVEGVLLRLAREGIADRGDGKD